MDRDITLSGLEDFKNHVINKARQNLVKNNLSGNLSKSIGGEAIVSPNSITISFSMEEYGAYQDQGVSGTKKKFDTPFSYKNKMPPAKAFDKFQIKRGLATRNKKGQFTSRKAASFAIARHIFYYGIRPKKFFTNAFEGAFATLPDEIVELYGLDVERLLKISLNNGKRD